MKNLIVLLTIALTAPTMAEPIETLNEAVAKLNRIERKLDNLKSQASETRSLIYDALYELQNQSEPQVTCSTPQSGRTLTASAPTKDQVVSKLMKQCIALNVTPSVCRLNMKYNIQCY